MIFVIRHGERADEAGSEEKKNIVFEFDPPLTALGCRQAEATGLEINSLLKNFGYKPKRFIMVSSPFQRCAQTSLHIAKKLEGELFENTIFLQDSLGEFFHRTWFDRNVLPELIVRSRNTDFKKIDPLYDKINFKDAFIPEKDLIQPKYPEDFNEYYKRVDFCFRNLRDFYFEKFNPNEDVLVCVSHGYAVQVVLENYGALQKLTTVDYCCINQFYYPDIEGYRDKPKQLLVCGSDHIKGKLGARIEALYVSDSININRSIEIVQIHTKNLSFLDTQVQSGSQKNELLNRSMAQSLTDLAKAFISAYYTAFQQNKLSILSFYTDVSTMTYGGDTFTGSKQIMEKVESFGFQKIVYQVETFDAQPGPVPGSFMVLASGTLQMDDTDTYKFSQIFNILPNNSGGYYCHNDIFRIIV